MINQIIIESFNNGGIELDRAYDESGLKSYTSGLVSNWLRKDKRLNGGTQYVAKNPGSRAGSSDPELKAMRALLSTLTDEADRAEVQGLIDAKVATINATKSTKTIDFSALPAELREKFQK